MTNLNRQVVAEVVDRFMKGEKIEDLAAEFGVDVDAVRDLIHEVGLD